MSIRALAVASAALLLISCDRVRERQLIGTWRTKNPDGSVDEIAFQSDHTLVWWGCFADLAIPQTIVSTGQWHVRQKQLVIYFNRGAKPSELSVHQILKIGINTLLLKPPDSTNPMAFHRIETPICAAPKSGETPDPIEPNIPGIWQVHFHTHEFRYRFAPDHRVAVSGFVDEEAVPLWNGTWKVSGNHLLLDLKSETNWKDGEDGDWTLYDFQPRCFKIKDADGVSYVVHKVD